MTFSKKTTPLHSPPHHSTSLHSTHSTELFKIFFSLLTLSTAFLQKASGPGKNNKSIELFDYNTVQIIYNDNIDTLKSDTNKSNISSNLEITNTNKNDISSNLEIINTNKSDISSNLETINTNKRNISSNLGIINTSKSNISSNLGKIDANKNDISSNLGKIDTNKNNILSNLEKIKELNQNKICLKNISTDIFYNEDTQINFSNDQLFFEKEYNILFKKMI